MSNSQMTRRQFNRLLMLGVLISTEGLLNNSLAASSLTNTIDSRNLGSLSATSLINAIKNKKISSTELIQYFMERHKRLNPKINAIVATDFESALKRARKADEDLANEKS